MPEIAIRPPESPAEYRSLQDAQRRAWGLADESYVLPLSTMVSAHHHGGLVLGAFAESGEAVGLSFGFLGRIGGRLGLYSQLTGVVPGHQGSGLGTRLKEAQRTFCRREGIDLVAWAFDPMQAGNAAFNLQRLGATARTLLFDLYGPRTDALSAGVPTDRLIAEWEMDAEPPMTLSEDEIRGLPKVIRPGPSGNAADGPTVAGPRPWSDRPTGPRSLLEIPATITAMRRERPDLAAYWQALVTTALVGSFELGYRAVGFARMRVEGEADPRCYYVLDRPA